MDVDGVYERRPRPLCPPHLITLRFNYMLRFLYVHIAVVIMIITVAEAIRPAAGRIVLFARRPGN